MSKSTRARIVYGFGCMGAFWLGAYGFWIFGDAQTAVNTLPKAPTAPVTDEGTTSAAGTLVAEVAGERLTQEDVEWEYRLLTEGQGGVFDRETLTPIPDPGDRYHRELAPLRRALLQSLIERKVLYAYLQRDRAFPAADPARYTPCLEAWAKASESLLATQPALLPKGRDRERLKARLCERAIVSQYLTERVFPGVGITDDEVLEYYRNHRSELRHSEMVEIRQILLGSEAEAKKAKAMVTTANFADLARARSLAPEAEAGGRLKPYARGAMPPVFDAAFRLKPGEISDVLKSNYGFHLIMLIRQTPAADLNLEEARPRILAALRRVKQDQAYAKWLDQALAAIHVAAPKPIW